MNFEDRIGHYRAEIRGIVQDRPWLVATDVLVGSARMAEELLGFGADRVLAIGASRGTGEIPSVPKLQCMDLGHHDDGGMMAAIRSSQALLADLPQEVRAAVEHFDPKGEARAIGTLFADGSPIADRGAFGGRPRAWQALEDKMIVDALWDAVGIERAPSEIIPTSFEELWAAHGRLDQGLGTVWVGDNREGWHGGANLLRWVRDRADGTSAQAFLAQRCDRVRVMPFLDGTPCSIHGWVFKDEVISFRPCEMLVFRVPGSSQLSYAGSASAWVPRDGATQAMQEGAQRVGVHLRETVGYRGCFTMDGVITKAGFRPTELNPRFGAAIAGLQRGMPDLPLYLLHLACAEGLDLDYRPQALQTLVREGAAAHPTVRGMHMLAGLRDCEPMVQKICRHGDGWRPAEDGEPADGSLRLGPSAVGAIVFAALEPSAIEIGPSAAADVCSMLAFAATLWDLDIGDLEPAPDLRVEQA